MKKILILEDDSKIAAALAIRLSAAGYDVSTAPDGLQGIHEAVKDPPDLLLMDIWMPVGLGLSVAQRLKEVGMGEIPIIFITASKLKGLKEAALRMGAVAFFEKPYEPEKLLSAVAQALYPTPVPTGLVRDDGHPQTATA
jgi:two-component system nitrogen regulation response regulator NtrX